MGAECNASVTPAAMRTSAEREGIFTATIFPSFFSFFCEACSFLFSCMILIKGCLLLLRMSRDGEIQDQDQWACWLRLISM